MKINTPETAPKDMTVFLGDVGYPWFLPVVWNPNQEEWVCATLQACPMNKESGGEVDTWFENEYEKQMNLKGWIPIPDLK